MSPTSHRIAGGLGPVLAQPPAQSLGRGTVLVTAASALFVLSGYIVNITLGRTLGPADYGLFGVVIGLMAVLNAVQSASIPQAVAKATAEQRYPPEEILFAGATAQLAGGLVLGLILFLFADSLASLLGDERLGAPFKLAAFVLPPFALFSLLMGFRGGQGRYTRQALILSVYSVAKAGFAIGLGALFGLAGAIIGYLLAALAALPASGIWRLGARKMAPLRPMLMYSLPLLVIGLLFMSHLNLDLFYVKALLPDPETAGHYTAAQNIARVPYFLASGFSLILLPAMARSTARTRESAQGLVGDSLRLGFIAIAPLAALLVGGSDELVSLLYGAEYEPATPVLRLLGPAVASIAMSGLIASMLSGTGRPGLAILAVATGLGLTAVVGVFLVPAFGGTGAAIATLVGAGVSLGVGAAALARVQAVTLPIPTIVRAGAAACAVGLAASVIDGNVAFLLGVPVLLVVYGASLIVLGELRTEDWSRLRKLLPGQIAGKA